MQKPKIQTNEKNEAICALEHTCKLAMEIESDVYNWKWAIISFHNSIQNMTVCALTSTHGLFTMPGKNMSKWLKAFYGKTPYPKDYLDFFEELYKKTKEDQYMQQYVMSCTFTGTQAIDKSIHRINDCRNIFIHFTPKTYGFLPGGMPKLFLELLEYIDFLGNKSGNILWLQIEKKRFNSALSKANKTFKSLYKSYSRIFKINESK